MLYRGVAKGIKEKPMDVAVKSVKGEYVNVAHNYCCSVTNIPTCRSN